MGSTFIISWLIFKFNSLYGWFSLVLIAISIVIKKVELVTVKSNGLGLCFGAGLSIRLVVGTGCSVIGGVGLGVSSGVTVTVGVIGGVAVGVSSAARYLEMVSKR